MKKTTIIATGDSFMTRRLPEGGYEGFEALRRVIAEYDVRFNNLETTIHRNSGYPAAFSGGTWAMSDPEVLDDLNTFGFNVYNTANNHSCDYSHGGLLATIANLQARKTVFCGTGANLFEASRPCYIEAPQARVAVLAACSSFHDSDAAGNQSLSLPGRPGLNPLRYTKVFNVKADDFAVLSRIAEENYVNADKLDAIRLGYAPPFPEGYMAFGELRFQRSDTAGVRSFPLEKDMVRMEKNIRDAKLQADYVLVSIHAHEFAGNDTAVPAEFLRHFAHRCIDAGADAILGHGPHELRGIEIYGGKPIFYSLGNFIFETETVAVQSADAYENKSLPHDTLVGEYMNERSAQGTRGYGIMKQIWASVMAGFIVEDGAIREITLYPITLGMDKPRGQMGLPQLAEDTWVINYLAKLSAPFGTEIRIENGVGKVILGD